MEDFDVVGVGLNATDTVLMVPRFPAYGGKAPFTREFYSVGGQVATAVVTCARLGLRAKYIGSVGDDERGRIQMDSLRASGIDVEHVQQRANCSNQSAYVVVDESTGERTIFRPFDHLLDAYTRPILVHPPREDSANCSSGHADDRDAARSLWGIHGAARLEMGGICMGIRPVWALINDRVKLLAYRIFDPIEGVDAPQTAAPADDTQEIATRHTRFTSSEFTAKASRTRTGLKRSGKPA